MAQPAIALDFNQTANVHLDLFAEIALYPPFGFDLLAKLIHLFFGQILDLLGFIHFGLGAERAGALLANAVDRRQADPQALIDRQIYSSNACHKKPLTLALLVLRIAAYHPNHSAPMNDFALIANLFYRGPNLHFRSVLCFSLMWQSIR